MNRFTISFLHFLFGVGLLVCSSGCLLHRLDVQTQYLSRENLASYHVGTPDPNLDNPIIGQRLLIQWSLCANEIEGQVLFLHLLIRLRDHREQEFDIPITKKWGFYIYDLTNEDYCTSGGVLTYKAEIRNESCVIASWKHPLWANLITFDFAENDSVSNQSDDKHK
jgi:hypothetical protein